MWYNRNFFCLIFSLFVLFVIFKIFKCSAYKLCIGFLKLFVYGGDSVNIYFKISLQILRNVAVYCIKQLELLQYFVVYLLVVIFSSYDFYLSLFFCHNIFACYYWLIKSVLISILYIVNHYIFIDIMGHGWFSHLSFYRWMLAAKFDPKKFANSITTALNIVAKPYASLKLLIYETQGHQL